MADSAEQRQRIEAALCGAVAGAARAGDPGAPEGMIAVSESLAARGGLDVDDARQGPLNGRSGVDLLLGALPFGLATPLDRPRLRRDAYRFAAALHADEGTTLLCVAAALVAADLSRFDAVTTAIRVRQSLLEDAPMALLNRLTLLGDESAAECADPDPGCVLQLALSVVGWTDAAGVRAALERVDAGASGPAAALVGALAGAASGTCDVPVEERVAERASRAAAGLAGLAAAAVG